MQTNIKNNKRKSPNRTTNGSFGSIARLDEIAVRAHEIYVARGAEPGRELDDWLQAEREIMEWI